MKKGILAASLLALSLAACTKHDADTSAPPAPAADAVPAEAAPAPEPAAPPVDDRAKSEAQARLDYATMEDRYINDADAQWAVAAKASSSFSNANNLPPDSHELNTPWQATGPVNGNEWTNNNQDIGFDWLQLDYGRPVSATAVRAVLDENAVKSITRVELIDAEGAAHEVWSGVSDVQADKRGSRTWFVRTFEPTPYPARSVKLTFANNVASGYKTVDAVQLVGK